MSPSCPDSGEVLIPIVTDSDGSSTVITGSGRGSSADASVSPIVISGIPATEMISPAAASSASTRSSASVTYSSETLTRSICPSARHQATVSPRRIVPWRTRQIAIRPTYGDASRFVTCAWKRVVGVVLRRRDVRDQQLDQRAQVAFPGTDGSSDAQPALAFV